MNKNNILLGIVVVLVIVLIAWPKLSGRKNTNNGEDTTTTATTTDTTTSGSTSTISVGSGNTPSGNMTVGSGSTGTSMATGETMMVRAFFGNSVENPSSLVCEAVYPVARTIPRTTTVARAAMEQTLRGVTASESAEGYYTSINEGTQVNSLKIENGVAHVDLSASLNTGVAGACRVTNIRSQITETLKQFSNVKSVVISVNGKTEGILQP